MNQKKVYILLTKFSNHSSHLFSFITGDYYTHASIGLEEDMNIFYSFVNKGFIIEEITRYVKHQDYAIPCLLYELEVPKSTYENLQKNISHFIKNKNNLYYTQLGLILCLLKIPFKKKNHYFCSQFVAEILSHNKIIQLNKKSSLYLPEDFQKTNELQLSFQGDLQSMIHHYQLH